MIIPYYVSYFLGIVLILGIFGIIGIIGRPKQRTQPLEIHEKEIFGGGEPLPTSQINYLTPLIGFLTLFVALDASLLVLITSLGKYLSPILYMSILLFSVMLIGVELD
jgi:hypothetical protein